MKTYPDHRGLSDRPGSFAKAFVLARIDGFKKDLAICLRPMPSKARKGNTHAYFPALGACFGLMEYLTALRRGSVNGIGWQQIAEWAEDYLPAHEYSRNNIRVLFDAFRHSVAHRGIASGVWVDQNQGPTHGFKLTWSITAASSRPAFAINAKPGVLKKDPPWPTPYTHRVSIHLKAFAKDIIGAAYLYAAELEHSEARQSMFYRCMQRLYPRDST